MPRVISCSGQPRRRALRLRFWLTLFLDTAHSHHVICLLTCKSQAAPGDEPPKADVVAQREELFTRLGWRHWARAERSRQRHAFPAKYPLF